MLAPDLFADQRVTVMGLGTFGGGVGAVQFLLKHGAQVTLTDLRGKDVLNDSLSQIDCRQLTALVLEEHREQDFASADYVVVNPAIPIEGNRFLDIAKNQGAQLTSEINLFWQYCKAKKIVITGTVGKSTTTALIHQGLLAAGLPARIGGNIGVSLLPEVDEITPEEWVVLELSSFQLTSLNAIRCQPDVAVVTNFAPNHLDWHRTLEHYAWAKQACLRWQTDTQFAVLNAEIACLTDWPTAANRIWFGSQLADEQGVRINDDSFSISGGSQSLLFSELAPCLQFIHQQQNVAAALAALCHGVGLSLEQVRPAFSDFQSLPHRFELLPTQKSQRVINDSKATTPEATLAALSSLDGPVVLIAGGKEKQIDLSELCTAIAGRVEAVALIGDTATDMQNRINAASSKVSCQICLNLSQAVTWATSQSSKHATILLSPGCASHSEFKNYEDRGNQFRRLILSRI